MPNRYAITKRDDCWVVLVEGAMLLRCSSRKTALRAIRDAIAFELRPPPAAEAIVAAHRSHPDNDCARGNDLNDLEPLAINSSS